MAMKFLVFSDVHGNRKAVQELLSRAGQDDVDAIICAGDFSQFGSGMRWVLREFNAVGKPFYVIPGNHEENLLAEAMQQQQYEHCIYLHKKAIRLPNGYLLLGYGGGGFAMEDAEFRKIAREWYGKYKVEKIILVTHGPAFGTKLDLMQNRHVGNKDYRKFIDRIKPKLVISGHLHETIGGVDAVGTTKLINPCWEGMVVEVR